MKRLFAALFLLLTLAVFPQSTQIKMDGSVDPVRLTVYLHDRCGGCGVDTPGCGDCKDIVKYHGVIKKQLGDRLYDGTIDYRMLNTRMLANEELYWVDYAAYAVPENVYGVMPMAFLGRAEDGVYLAGEEMLEYVAQAMDAYMAGDDRDTIRLNMENLRLQTEAVK